jgi:hypothetical protein
MMAARAAADWVENVVSNGWRATTLGQKLPIVNDGYQVGHLTRMPVGRQR